MKKYIYTITVLLLIACSDHDTYSESFAVAKACKICDTNPSEMQWLRDIIQENNGNVYAINTSEGVFIIHQPIHMSCIGCVRYTCSGSQPTVVTPAVQEEIQNGIKKSNLIYKPTF